MSENKKIMLLFTFERHFLKKFYPSKVSIFMFSRILHNRISPNLPNVLANVWLILNKKEKWGSSYWFCRNILFIMVGVAIIDEHT